MQAERLPVAAHDPHPFVGRDPTERGRATAGEAQPGVAGQLARRVHVDHAVLEERVDVGRGDGHVRHAGPAGRHHVERVVLVGGEPDGGRLHPQRHVLGDQHDRAPALGAALGGEVERASQDARVVGIGAKARGEHLRVGVVELDVQRAAHVTDGDGRVQSPVFDAQVIERPQRGAGEPPQLGVVPLALQLGDHHQRQDDFVLLEPGQRPRVGKENRGVEHVAAPGFRALCASSRFDHGCSLVGAAPRPLSGGPACPARTSATPPRTPARAGCRPSRVCDTTTRASRAVPHRVRVRRRKRYRRSPGCGQLQRRVVAVSLPQN